MSEDASERSERLQRVLQRVKKCMAVAQSRTANEHEAAIALRQAQKLMAEHQLSTVDVLASDVARSTANAGAKRTPVRWEVNLANLVARTFACKLLFQYGFYSPGHWVFIGCNGASDIAGYAFSVLYRQAKAARTRYIAESLKRCKLATKRYRADLFSVAWVEAVEQLVGDFGAVDAATKSSIAAYMSKQYPAVGPISVINRNEGRKLKERELRDMDAGYEAGRQAQLNRGLSGDIGADVLMIE